jgi:hypothetical protein
MRFTVNLAQSIIVIVRVVGRPTAPPSSRPLKSIQRSSNSLRAKIALENTSHRLACIVSFARTVVHRFSAGDPGHLRCFGSASARSIQRCKARRQRISFSRTRRSGSNSETTCQNSLRDQSNGHIDNGASSTRATSMLVCRRCYLRFQTVELRRDRRPPLSANP